MSNLPKNDPPPELKTQALIEAFGKKLVDLPPEAHIAFSLGWKLAINQKGKA